RDYLVNHAYKNNTNRVVSIRNFGYYETIEDIIPYEIIAKAAGKYIASILDAKFEIDTQEHFVIQLTSYANKKNYNLPANYLDEISARVKRYFIKNFDSIKISRPLRKVWEKLLTTIVE